MILIYITTFNVQIENLVISLRVTFFSKKIADIFSELLISVSYGEVFKSSHTEAAFFFFKHWNLFTISHNCSSTINKSNLTVKCNSECKINCSWRNEIRYTFAMPSRLNSNLPNWLHCAQNLLIRSHVQRKKT